MEANSIKALERFTQDTANHSMKIISDDGDVSRCVRFTNQGSSVYSYTLTTWPGYLCISGDMGTAVFCRTYDMFGFFGDGDRINPDYWGEKLEAASDYKKFCEESLKQSLKDWLEEKIAGDYGGDYELDVSSQELENIVEEVLPEASTREEAIEILKNTEIDPSIFLPVLSGEDFIEFEDFIDQANGCYGDFESFEDYTSRYLWLCWAVAKGSKQYRDSKSARGVK